MTFLKRKGGLFKKAHELSVLCSVDVAVIIFGHNKKLYEYSSGDINETIGRFQYYGAAHEHKGPADFNGRSNLDDDDDDEMGTPPMDDNVPSEQNLPPHLQNQAGYTHMRHAPSASPPVSNGVPYHNRQHTPQAQMQMGSRPGSRNAVRRPSSNLGMMQSSQAAQGPNGYAYMPNPPIYNPHAAQSMPVASHHGLPNNGLPNQRFHGVPSSQQYTGQPQQHPQPHHVQQTYTQDQRRQSMPPTFSQAESQHLQPPVPSPPQPERAQEDEQQPYAPKPINAKSRSIFTPIDDSRSLLAQHWSIGDKKDIKTEKDTRSQSVDISTVQKQNANRRLNESTNPKAKSSQPSPPQAQLQKGAALPRASQASEFPPPSRTNSAPMGAKRPRLKVQIPSEQSDDDGEASAESSTRQSGGTVADTPAKGSTEASHSSGVVLPPPSPSASAILSAGAQGPPNPFARPHPPNHSSSNNQSYNSNNNIETPISALPSRFITNELLPSPSSFYPEWGFGRGGGEGNMLPSPLNFQTPMMGNGPSFLREEEGDKKRKSPEGDSQEGSSNLKRVKT